MCKFFSFVTQPSRSSDKYYFDWNDRQGEHGAGADSHSHICHVNGIDEDACNKWEYNPLTKELVLDMQNDPKNDEKSVRRWLDKLDWKTIAEPLLVKPVINPLSLPKVNDPTAEQIAWLKEWADAVKVLRWTNVWAYVRASVWARDSVWAAVRDSVWAAVRDSVWAAVRDSVWFLIRDAVIESVKDLTGAYILTFIDAKWDHDITSATKLWEAGLVPSYDGETWRLHSGKSAEIVYQWTPDIAGSGCEG